MANDRNKIFEQAKSVIEEHDLVFIEEIVSYLPISKPTFYDYFPIGSNEINALKELLEDNKIKTKASLRKNWATVENPTLQITLYKLLSNAEEERKLSIVKQEISGPEGRPIETTVNLEKLSTDDLERLEELAKLASNPKGT
jgi:hypothetical protein